MEIPPHIWGGISLFSRIQPAISGGSRSDNAGIDFIATVGWEPTADQQSAATACLDRAADGCGACSIFTGPLDRIVLVANQHRWGPLWRLAGYSFYRHIYGGTFAVSSAGC